MDRAALEAQLAEGRSIESIARESGRAPSTVAYWVNKHGLMSQHAPRHARARRDRARATRRRCSTKACRSARWPSGSTCRRTRPCGTGCAGTRSSRRGRAALAETAPARAAGAETTEAHCPRARADDVRAPRAATGSAARCAGRSGEQPSPARAQARSWSRRRAVACVLCGLRPLRSARCTSITCDPATKSFACQPPRRHALAATPARAEAQQVRATVLELPREVEAGAAQFAVVATTMRACTTARRCRRG